MCWNDFLYLCLSWPAALEHGKIEENNVNIGICKGLREIREIMEVEGI